MRSSLRNGFRAALLGFILLMEVGNQTCHADDMEAANRAYTAGSYAEAASLFQQIVDRRGYSAPLCFDLANAEAQAGQPGPALLNYERARYLAPSDRAIDHNLQLERKKAGLEPNSFRWWQVVLRSIDWTVWMGLIVADLVLISVAIIGLSARPAPATARLPRRGWRLFFRAVLFVGIPLGFFLAYIELATVGFNQRLEGVIVAPKAAVLFLSPIDLSDSVGSIPEGELVTVEDRHQDYLRIEARDHHFGWVHRKDIAPIVAGSFDDKAGD